MRLFKYLFFFLLIAQPVFAQSTNWLASYQASNGVNQPVSTSTPLPVGVYGGSSATSGYCLTSNGPGSVATFQVCGGGGGGGGTVTSVTFTGDGTVLSSTPSGAVTASGTLTATLANQTANTLLGALTATTPSDIPVPSCSTSASALLWTSGTGFSCNTGIAASTVTTNANLTGPITSSGNATSIASQTGTGSTFVVSASPTLTGSPVLSTASATSIGIGTTTISASNKLEVNGSASIGYTDIAAPTNGLIVSGNVGIGTTSPVYNLSQYALTGGSGESQLVRVQRSENYGVGNANDYRDYLGIDIGYMGGSGNRAGVPVYAAYILSELTATPTTTTAAPYPLYFGTGSSSDGTTGSQIGFVTLGSERMRITSGGLVGIGTTSPLVKLDVIGITIATNTPNSEDEFHITRLINGGVSWPEVAAFQLGSYNTGVGTAPDTRLDINLKAAANAALTGDTNVMTLQANGNVGIGTTSPTSALNVGSGQIETASGSVSAPPHSFTTDTNTGLYDVATGTLGVAAQGVQAMTISSTAVTVPLATVSSSTSTGALLVTGGVGIGGNLYVGGGTIAATNNGGVSGAIIKAQYIQTSAYIPISTTLLSPVVDGLISYNSTNTNSAVAGLDFNSKNASGNAQHSWITQVNNSGAGVYTPSLAFGQSIGTQSYTERMRFDQNGVLGIGTTTMSSSNIMEANGAVSIGYPDTAAPSSGLIVSGNVGIGSATPITNSILSLSGHLGFYQAATPVVSSCGSGAAVAGSTDSKGQVTGIITATACTITFGTAMPTAPACSFSDSAGTAVGITSISTAAVTTTMVSLTGSLYYICY